MDGSRHDEAVLVDERSPDESMSAAVLRLVATARNVEPESLEHRLYGSIDTDALNSIFAGDREGQLRFRYDGYVVTVRGSGEISVRPAPQFDS